MAAASRLRRATSDQGPKLSRPQAVEGKVREKATTPSTASSVPPPPEGACAAVDRVPLTAPAERSDAGAVTAIAEW
ncbi:hypothetical protein Sfulv_08850 [Streptomyces fulvorobeus]|uniref:Uncharacterized protein n=1 Tax=Streptomyces fulvorobeus TaxID=284028 RepID=A0A7J0C295_9ACTN|nr:hypothetical protein Sfulv_08850 [Streptomyces fulvorobeus]